MCKVKIKDLQYTSEHQSESGCQHGQVEPVEAEADCQIHHQMCLIPDLLW